MAYYSGQASSYQEVLNALVAACTTHGWSWADGILNKGGLYLKPTVFAASTASQGAGITMQAGTGKNGVNLINPSAGSARMGPIGAGSVSFLFPCDYYIHVFEKEVYLITQTNLDCFFYLTFGDNETIWCSASTDKTYYTGTSPAIGNDFYIMPSGGGHPSYNSAGAGFWWRINNNNCWDNFLLMNNNWSFANNSLNAISSLEPLSTRGLSSFNSEGLLNPICCFNIVESNKVKLVLSILNARYMRIDSYEPGQILTLGNEKWKVYPFYKKNNNSRNGGGSISNAVAHTGTMGWAIRYDGP